MWESSESSKWHWISGLTVLSAGAVAVAWYHRRRRSSSNRPLRRSVSFTSIGLAVGSFPETARVPDAIINAACYFGDHAPPPMEAIVAQIVEPLLLRYERLSHVLDMRTAQFQPASRPYQPRDLVRFVDTQSKDEAVLHKTIFDHIKDPLTHEKRGVDLPWWELVVFHNRGAGPSALVIRVHHALADGLALVYAFEKIFTSAEDGSPIQLPIPPPRDPSPSPGRLSMVWSILEATWHVLTLGATKYDDEIAFSKGNHAHMRHSGRREYAIFPPVSLDFVKALKSAANCTVNDVVTAAISQAIHDYCVSHDDAILAEKQESVQCRALFPVGFPRSAKELANPSTALRNKWCVVSCDIAVGCRTMMDRLCAVRNNTMILKGKPRALVQLSIQNNIAPLLPKSVGRQTVMDIFSRHSLVLTNVPGPPVACALAGQPLTAVQLFFDNLLTQVNIVSYSGQIWGNIVYDPDALDSDSMKEFGQSYARALTTLAEQLKVEVPQNLNPYK